MSQSPLEIRHLQTLMALADTGSLGKAAERVFVSQSALSHQLKALEVRYGAPLFERNTKPLRFTQAGARLVTLAREVLAMTAQAEREVAQWVSGRGGQLRVAVECHTCFDWLMPAMDAFRDHWPDVELDLVGGFQIDPMALIESGAADFAVIHDQPPARTGIAIEPLFSYETMAILSPRHALARKAYLTPADFADQTLISYPVDEDMLDVVRHFLAPAGVTAKRRKVELTVAILQLVASGRGIAALPEWSVAGYLERGYVVGKPLGEEGLRCELYAAIPESLAAKPFMADFIAKVRRCSSTA
ncbi:LysR family transcriptional regulator for metE and metH [Panacagrimonas perspica]|uniref:HTH-type transcriptional regulator MetR n=1 Tax=Panacagrimonas perspica TaxID=381431 RepID=A0A4R7PEU9_9GAMM|nr:LysR family transcriptional regulator [Panacagrimonas perspica]TDU31840.1 LysR family transcriptional regulator for metE and metH [Panacagrimonas perspica]THD02957.1 LysR family transcriptional regulator [Panacagrimonas perspica]